MGRRVRKVLRLRRRSYYRLWTLKIEQWGAILHGNPKYKQRAPVVCSPPWPRSLCVDLRCIVLMRSHQPSGVCVLYLVASDLLDVHDVKCCEMHVKCCSTLFDLHFLYHFVRCWARASASLSLVLSWAQWSNSVGHGLALPVKLYQAGCRIAEFWDVSSWDVSFMAWPADHKCGEDHFQIIAEWRPDQALSLCLSKNCVAVARDWVVSSLIQWPVVLLLVRWRQYADAFSSILPY